MLSEVAASREMDSRLKREAHMGASSISRVLQLEHIDDAAQHRRLILHGLCRSGRLFNHCRVLLRGLVYLSNGDVDLLDGSSKVSSFACARNAATRRHSQE